MTSAPLRVGTSSWSEDDWRGPFYPKDLPKARYLDHYAQHFTSVEINNSFYRLPETTTFDNWRSSTPAGFEFAVKASQLITHRRKLKQCADAVGEFLGRTARLEDKLCRFLTAGDVDGDGVKEMVAAAHKSGLWLLKPGADGAAEWSLSSIDRNSAGFEHAAILTDLDGDGIDELYVANDKGKDVNRYTWQDGQAVKEQLFA